jgi:hypothetical protein
MTMFEDFANVWTIVGRERDLRNAPLGLSVAGEGIVSCQRKSRSIVAAAGHNECWQASQQIAVR